MALPLHAPARSAAVSGGSAQRRSYRKRARTIGVRNDTGTESEQVRIRVRKRGRVEGCPRCGRVEPGVAGRPSCSSALGIAVPGCRVHESVSINTRKYGVAGVGVRAVAFHIGQLETDGSRGGAES